MSGPENTFIASVHKHLSPTLYRIKNNNVYNAGQADVWYSGQKADLWVEYKFITVPVRDGTVIDFGLSHLQKEWLSSRHSEGRNVGVIVGCKSGGLWLPGTVWDTPYTADRFRRHILSRNELAGAIIAVTT